MINIFSRSMKKKKKVADASYFQEQSFIDNSFKDGLDVPIVLTKNETRIERMHQWEVVDREFLKSLSIRQLGVERENSLFSSLPTSKDTRPPFMFNKNYESRQKYLRSYIFSREIIPNKSKISN